MSDEFVLVPRYLVKHFAKCDCTTEEIHEGHLTGCYADKMIELLAAPPAAQPSNALSGVHAYAIYDDATGKFLGYGSDDKPFNSEGKRARAVPVMGKLADLQASNALSGKLRERAKIMDATGQFALSYFNQSDAWLMRSAADALEAMSAGRVT